MKKYNKQISIILVAVLILAGGVSSLLVKNETAFATEDKDKIDSAISSVTSTLTGSYEPFELASPNTIYVIQDADGTANKMIQLNENEEFDYLDVASAKRPIEVQITYTLDGKSVTADEIAGKSGRVGIKFSYVNNETQTVDVDGESLEMKTPYVALSGVILDGDSFSNVEVKNGRAVDDGSRVIAAGIALPGVKESIDPESRISAISNVPDYIEIAADTTNFNLSMTVTAALPLNDEKLDLSEFQDLTDVSSKLDLLQSAMTQLTSGSDQLAVATEKLDAGMGNLSSAIGSLDFGLSEISANSDALRSGDTQVFNTLLSTVHDQLVEAGIECPELTIENYDEVLQKIIDSLSDEAVYNKVLAGVTEQVEAHREEITTLVTNTVKDEVRAQLSLVVPPEQLEAAVEQQMQTETTQALIAVNVETTIQSKIDEQMQSDTVQAILEASYAAAKEGREKVQAAKDQLDTYNVFHEGVSGYTGGVDTASGGASQIASGSSQIKSGTSQLSTGASSLASGINQLNNDGISQIVDLLSGDIFNIIKRANKLIELGKSADEHVYIMRSASVGQ